MKFYFSFFRKFSILFDQFQPFKRKQFTDITNLKITDNFIHIYIYKQVELKQLECIYFQIGCGSNNNVLDVDLVMMYMVMMYMIMMFIFNCFLFL